MGKPVTINVMTTPQSQFQPKVETNRHCKFGNGNEIGKNASFRTEIESDNEIRLAFKCEANLDGNSKCYCNCWLDTNSKLYD